MLCASVSSSLVCTAKKKKKKNLYDPRREKEDKGRQPRGLGRPLRSLLRGAGGGGLGTGGSAAPLPSACVCRPTPPASLQPPRQALSFGSLIISARLPHCICNDLFTSLCRLPRQTGPSLRTGAASCSRSPPLPLPHTAWHGAGPGGCTGTAGCVTLVYVTEGSRFTDPSLSILRGGLVPPSASPLSGAGRGLDRSQAHAGLHRPMSQRCPGPLRR